MAGRVGRWLMRLAVVDQWVLEYWWFSEEPIEDEE